MHTSLRGRSRHIRQRQTKKLPGGQQLSGYDFGYHFDGIGNRITADVNGNVQQYTANSLNQYEQRTMPGAVDVIGETSTTATLQVNNVSAYRQGKYFHAEVPVSNVAQPQYPLITITADVGTTSATAQGNRYVPKTPELYTYDFDGNLLSDGRWSYTWDGENRLIGLESLATVPVAAKKKIAYQYDYMGRRIAKTTQSWDAITGIWQSGVFRTFFYDGWNLIGEMEGGSMVGSYTWGLDLSGSLQGAGGVGGLLSTSDGVNTSYAISDANGNVIKLVSETGGNAVVGEYEYGPFGELLRMTGPDAEGNPFRFSTKYQEPESGLLYYGYRYFDAEIGRWMSRDPLEEIGGLNILNSTGNDLINGSDYLGLFDISLFEIEGKFGVGAIFGAHASLEFEDPNFDELWRAVLKFEGSVAVGIGLQGKITLKGKTIGFGASFEGPGVSQSTKLTIKELRCTGEIVGGGAR